MEPFDEPHSLDESMFLSMRGDNDELMRLLTAILKTTWEHLNNGQ